jgi:hypothetical protein
MTTNETTKIQPVAGMGCSYGAGSDSYPGTITRVSESGKTLWMRHDEVLVLSGSFQTGDCVYTTIERDDTPELKYSLRKSGRWVPVGCDDVWYMALGIGTRRYYQDPHF